MFVRQTRGGVNIISCVFSLDGNTLRILCRRKKLILRELTKGGQKNQTQISVQITCGQAWSDLPCSTFCRRGSGGRIGV